MVSLLPNRMANLGGDCLMDFGAWPLIHGCAGRFDLVKRPRNDARQATSMAVMMIQSPVSCLWRYQTLGVPGVTARFDDGTHRQSAR